MPSFADSIFLFILALLLFGPKKLPVLARELGKWMGEFRRASNEFKMQMDEEFRASEQAERQQKIAAMEAAAPIPPPLNEPPEPEHPHTRYNTPEAPEPSLLAPQPVAHPSASESFEQGRHPDPLQGRHPDPLQGRHPDPLQGRYPDSLQGRHPERSEGSLYSADPATTPEPKASTASTHDAVRPIATSGSLHMMPPATGLPTPRSSRPNALSSLVDAIPEAPGAPSSPTVSPSAKVGFHEPEPESLAHGD